MRCPDVRTNVCLGMSPAPWIRHVLFRNLGVHISKVKSVTLDSWTPAQIESMKRGGNAVLNDTFEANLPPGFKRPGASDYGLEQFIRAKYERKEFLGRGGERRRERREDHGRQQLQQQQQQQPQQQQQQQAPRHLVSSLRFCRRCC